VEDEIRWEDEEAQIGGKGGGGGFGVEFIFLDSGNPKTCFHLGSR